MTEMLKSPHPMFIEGYVPGQKRPRRSEMVAFNVTPAFKAMLEKMAWEQHTSLAHLVRCLVERGGLELLQDEITAEKGTTK